MSKRKDMLKRIAAGVLAVLLVVEGAGMMIFASEDEAESIVTQEAEMLEAELPGEEPEAVQEELFETESAEVPEGTAEESGSFSKEAEAVTEVSTAESEAEAVAEVSTPEIEAEESPAEAPEEAPFEREELPEKTEKLPEETEELPEEAETLLEEKEEPASVGSRDAGLVKQLKNAGSVTLSNSGYCEYASGQQSVCNGVTVGAGTRYYTANGNTAYCVEPEYPGSAEARTLTSYEIEDSAFNGYGAIIRKVMYRTYGAPGWKEDAAFYAKMQEALAYETANTVYKDVNQVGYVYGHLMMSKIFSDVKSSLHYSGDISVWNVGLYGTYAHMAQYTEELVNLAKKAAEAPSNFHVFLVPSTEIKNQSFMYWTYEPIGYLYVHKYKDCDESMLPVIGASYDMGGAKYRAFADAACTKAVGEVMTVPQHSTDTNVISLPLGTYWVKEVEGPTQGWYAVNEDPVKVTLTTEHITEAYRVYSGEKPYYAKLVIHKDKTREIPASVTDMSKYYRHGAVYNIYYDPDEDGVSTELIRSVKTKTVSGVTGVFMLPIGHYFALEVEGPANGGYELNEEPVPFDVGPGDCINNPAVAEDYLKVIGTADEPIFGGLRIKKVIAKASAELTDNNACYELKGAEFSVYSDPGLTSDTLVGTLTTDENGLTEVLSDLGEGTYYIVETKTSPGFDTAADFTRKNPKKVTITADDLEEIRVVTCREPAMDDPVTITIIKEDAEGEAIASLEGAQFEVRYYKGYYDEESLPETPERVWTLETKTDEKYGGYAAYFDEDYLVKDAENAALYYNSEGKPTIPLGTVAIVETKAPEGYTFEEGKILRVIRIDEAFMENGGQGGNTAAAAKVTVPEERARYRLSFTKKDRDGNPLANVPFLVKSSSTGEQHVLLTDKDGVLSTESCRHSVRTNVNDAAYSGGKLDETKLDPEAGVWFSGSSEYTTAVSDERGALLYGDYIITELRSSANEGLALIDPITVRISSDIADGGTIDLGSVIDENKNIITGVTSTRTGTQIALAEKNAAFTDKVTLSGYKGECVIKTRLYSVENGGQIAFADGTQEITTTISADGGETSTEVSFMFDASKMAGRAAAVVTEVSNSGETVIHNEDLTVEAEKIYFPIVSTKASVDGAKTVSTGGKRTITDIVTCAGFPEGTRVTAKAEAVRKGATAAEDEVLVTASRTAAVGAAKTINTNLSIDTDALGGAEVYINEMIYVTVSGKKILVAKESGRNNSDQTVRFVELKTRAENEKTGSGLAFSEKNAAFTDTLTVSGLVGEAEAVIKIYDVTGGQYTVFADGSSEIRKSFKAEGTEQEISIPFKLDGTALAGRKAAIEAAVTCGGETFTHNTAHDDLSEMVYFPSVSTAAASENGTQYAAQKKEAVITDTITWAGMPEGTVLTTKTRAFVRGDKAADDREISEAAVTNTYTAETENGSRDVSVTVDTQKYAGEIIYITEEDYISAGGKEILIASETDRDAIDQFIYIPNLVTTAVDAESGKKNISSSGQVSVLDTVKYAGFRAGEKLTTVTEAWAKGDQAKDDVLITTKKSSFVTGAEQGSFEVVLTFEADEYAGRDIYIVEKNYAGGRLVARENGRDNENQTVKTVTIGTTFTDAKTKTHRALAEENMTLQDEIAYSGLIRGEKYTICMLLMDEDGYAFKKDGTVSNLKAAEAALLEEQVLKDSGLIYVRTTETAKGTEGTFTVEAVFDGRAFSGRKLVASESIFEADHGSLLAAHSDPSDEGQTVVIPKIGTTLTDTETKTHISLADEEVVNVDTVAYSGLDAGETYPIIGILMNGEGYAFMKDGTLYKKVKAEELIYYKAGVTDFIFEKTPEEKAAAVGEKLDKLGLIWSRAEFTAAAEAGLAEVTFTYDGRALAGQKVIAGEAVYESGEVIAVHFEPEDAEQTVYLPKLITKAADAADGTKQIAEFDGENARIRDTVYYEGMLPGTEIVTRAKLYRKGDAAADDELLVEVKTDSITIPEENGFYTVDIPFDAAGLGGAKLYVTEENFIFVKEEDENGEEEKREIKISEHIDREDEAQTVMIPKIGTTLTDSATGAHISFADSDVTNYDHIAYENLEAGRSYPIVMIYMDENGTVCRKDGTAGSGTPMDYFLKADIAGTPEEMLEAVRSALEADNILFAVTQYTAEAESGEAVVEINYDGLPFAGRKVMAAEAIFEEGRLLAAHVDPEDEAQSMYFPKIVTRAANGADGSSYVQESRDAVITDTLHYEMYPAGTFVKTVLTLCNADTGEELKKDGKTLTTEKTFYPEGSGEEVITFAFDSTGLGSTRIGLRETNYVMNGDVWVPCATDSFLENEKQILNHIPKPDEPTPSVVTPSAAAPTPEAGRPGRPVKTGDASMPFVWVLLLFAGAITFRAALKPRKK